MQSKRFSKLLSMLLVFTLIFSQMIGVVNAADNNSNISKIGVEQLKFKPLVDEKNHVKFEVNMPNDTEKVVIDYSKDNKSKKEILVLSYYKNGILEHQTKPAYYEMTNNDLNYNKMLKEFKEQFTEQSQILAETDSKLLATSSTSLQTDIDSSVTSDLQTQSLSTINPPGYGQLFVSYGWAASSALYAALVASWPAIVTAGIVVAGIVTAVALYDWIMTNVVSANIDYNLTYSASKHMAESLVTAIVNPNATTPEVYFNPYSGTTLYVYDCSGFNGPINQYLYKDHGPYDFSGFDLTGFKLFVLYNPSSKQVFHAHVRWGAKAAQEVEYMRYDNKLVIRLVPTPPTVQMQYMNPNPTPSLGSDQLSK